MIYQCGDDKCQGRSDTHNSSPATNENTIANTTSTGLTAAAPPQQDADRGNDAFHLSLKEGRCHVTQDRCESGGAAQARGFQVH